MRNTTKVFSGTVAELKAKTRLEYLREQIENECISYGEIAELQSLVEYIEEDDVVLLEWAGVPENKEKMFSYCEKADKDTEWKLIDGAWLCLECK